MSNQRSVQNMVTLHYVREIGGKQNVKFSNLPPY